MITSAPLLSSKALIGFILCFQIKKLISLQWSSMKKQEKVLPHFSTAAIELTQKFAYTTTHVTFNIYDNISSQHVKQKEFTWRLGCNNDSSTTPYFFFTSSVGFQSTKFPLDQLLNTFMNCDSSEKIVIKIKISDIFTNNCPRIREKCFVYPLHCDAQVHTT